jgi:DNA repair exonuclease SbcCD ATPase subunit
MEIPAIALAILGAVAGPAASVKVASLQAGRTLADLEKRLAYLEKNEPETVAEMRDAIDSLAKDMATVRGAVERLTTAHEKLVADDEKRREKAAERAERRELREREQETALAAKLATVHTLLDTLRQEIRDARR